MYISIYTIITAQATALSYGIWKSARKLFDTHDAQHVMFVDVGHRSTSVCIAAFVQERLTVKSCAYNQGRQQQHGQQEQQQPNNGCGGYTVDALLVQDMVAAFQKKHPEIDCQKVVLGVPKIVLKLFAAAEKAKKTISPGSLTILWQIPLLINQGTKCNLICMYIQSDIPYSNTLRGGPRRECSDRVPCGRS
jgi:molecular chaperone DnaK (HSP70)